MIDKASMHRSTTLHLHCFFFETTSRLDFSRIFEILKKSSFDVESESRVQCSFYGTFFFFNFFFTHIGT